MAGSEKVKCVTHCNNLLESFCINCQKSGCEECKHVLHCYKNKHDVILIHTAVEEFNQKATNVMETAKDIKAKLERTLDFISKDETNFKSHLKLCRSAIEIQEKEIMEKVQAKSKQLFLELERLYQDKKEAIENQVKDLDLNQSEVKDLMSSINKIMNRPEETETLKLHTTATNALRGKVTNLTDQSFLNIHIIPNFVPSTYLYELISTASVGEIMSVNAIYKVDDDTSITVTEKQQFVIKVSTPAEIDTCRLTATLMNSSGEKSARVEYQKRKKYRLSGRCNVEGYFQMKITAGGKNIKGSPVNIKVETLGLVHTICNMVDYVEREKTWNVVDVALATDGSILVSGKSKYLLKFNQSGSFVDRIQMPQDCKVSFMHQINDGRVIYGDALGKCVIMCDDKFNKIGSFGKGILKRPYGTTVNIKTRVLYVADFEANCIIKFNINDGTLIGRIGSEGKKKLNSPTDVTLTKEGNVIVSDNRNNRILMFDANDNFMRTLVSNGDKDGEVIQPWCVIMDNDENLIVSSNHKLQLFGKNGIFIKIINHKDDGLDVPFGIAVTVSRPRKLVVANCRANNIKMFNY